jgi:hypothetical protein
MLSACMGTGVALGIPSGLWMGARVARDRSGIATGLIATGIAVLAASLGCIGLGMAGSLAPASAVAHR